MSTVTNFTAEMASAWMICVCSAFNKDANIMERDALAVCSHQLISLRVQSARPLNLLLSILLPTVQ